MIDHAGYRIICASGGTDELMQIIIFAIILAIGLIGNITKAKTQKRSGHTGDNRPDHKPAGQRSRPQTARPRPGSSGSIDDGGRHQSTPKYYEPGGFAEVLKDDHALEKTLGRQSRRILKKQNWSRRPEEESSIRPIESAQVMDQDLERMGHLDALDLEYSIADETASALKVSLESEDDLARAVLYSEIISKPVGLRGF